MRDMGKIMQAVMPKVKGRADGKAVNEIAKKYGISIPVNLFVRKPSR